MRRSRLFSFSRLKHIIPFHKRRGVYKIDGDVYVYDNNLGALKGVSKRVKGKIIQLKETVKS